ncbi:MAG: hypothetical protein MZV64_50435 [Ignavibacteriales bacterium]|nr:hypothetical protein [Ignavibacteriales bacterium]
MYHLHTGRGNRHVRQLDQFTTRLEVQPRDRKQGRRYLQSGPGNRKPQQPMQRHQVRVLPAERRIRQQWSCR